jgi:hypothetical protein
MSPKERTAILAYVGDLERQARIDDALIVALLDATLGMEDCVVVPPAPEVAAFWGAVSSGRITSESPTLGLIAPLRDFSPTPNTSATPRPLVDASVRQTLSALRGDDALLRDRLESQGVPPATALMQIRHVHIQHRQSVRDTIAQVARAPDVDQREWLDSALVGAE